MKDDTKNKLVLVMKMLDTIEGEMIKEKIKKNLKNLERSDVLQCLNEHFLSRENERYKKEIEEYKDKIKEKDKNLMDLCIFNKNYNSQMKGGLGEKALIDYLNELYSGKGVEIVTTAHEKHKADIWLKNMKTNTTFLIESKYRERNTSYEISKFISDCTQNYEKGLINVGLYISLENRPIPGKKDMEIEKINGVWVSYITGVIENPEKIRIIISLMKQILKVSTTMEYDRDETVIELNKKLGELGEYQEIINKLDVTNNDILTTVERQSKTIKSLKEKITTGLKDTLKYLKARNLLNLNYLEDLEKNRECKDIIIKESIEQFMIREGKEPKRDDIIRLTGYSNNSLGKTVEMKKEIKRRIRIKKNPTKNPPKDSAKNSAKNPAKNTEEKKKEIIDSLFDD